MQDGTDVPLRIGRYLCAHGVVSSPGNRGPPTFENWELVRTGFSTPAWFCCKARGSPSTLAVGGGQQVWCFFGVFLERDGV